VLVFDNVGCISRPDASGSPLEAVQPKRFAAGEASSRRAEAPSTRVPRSETSERRAKLFTSREQPGEQNQVAKEHFAGFRARLTALRIDVARTLIGRSRGDPRPSGSTARHALHRAAAHQRTVALEPFGRARAVTGSVRDGRQTAKAPPAERRGGSAWRRAHSRRVAATWTAGSRSQTCVARLLSASWQSQHLCHLRRIQPARTEAGPLREAHSGR
jgi:hypothetical protein